ncbi:trihelix transcription factor DF1 [Cryptomeria japonica]|uniref:trihelix transcription factor DF1 n=1 Tax=Cryptomeria japonica TaxID=3369 RepID=UPI0027D9CF56|nr:trihelix transcription factor DF1 [Cryptomeria japonica]
MQSGGGQYGVPGIQQFMEGCSSHGLFAALAASSSHDTLTTNTHHHLQSQPPQHHNINQQHHLQQQQQNQSFPNQRLLLQQQQQQLGLQAAVVEAEDKSRTRDLSGLSDKANKVFGFRETGGTSTSSNVQGVGDQVVTPLVVLQQQQQQLTDDDGDGERGGGGINRWPMEETLALLKIRSQMDSNFRDSNLKGPLWENVSRKLAELGYHRSSKKCKEKFENVNKYHKKTKDGRMGRQDGKSYRFFNELEALSNTIRHHLGTQQTGFNDAQEGDRLHQSMVMAAAAAETSNAALNVSSDTNNTSEDDEYNDNIINNNNKNNVISNPPPSRIKKRKRKQHFSSMAIFFESLVKQLMERQEELHRKFLEAIERREQERLNREEAWRRQEMARLTRETELRAQEQALANTREAALIAFLQKITGEDIKLPMASEDIQDAAVQEEQQDKDGMSDPCNGRRWPKPEVHALIRLRSSMEAKFQEPGVKGPLWEEISSGMASLGFHRSSKRCKEKWENINKYFRKTKDSMKKRPENAKTCPYFHQLDALYGKGLLASSSSAAGTSKSKGGHGHGSDGLMHEQAAGEDHDTNDKDNNDEDEDEGQAQARSDSELLVMIPGDSQAGGVNNGPDLMKTNADHFFQEDHPSHQSPKRFKSNSNQTPISLGSSFELSGSSKLESSSDSHKKAAKMERLVREMFEMQQKKFLDDFERREREQDRQQGMNKHDQNRQLQQQQGDVQDERSQSALMALVHKLTVNAADYASQ